MSLTWRTRYLCRVGPPFPKMAESPFWLKWLVQAIFCFKHPRRGKLVFRILPYTYRMSFSVEVLLQQVVSGDDAAVLLQLCEKHGLSKAVQLGMLDDRDAAEFLGPEYPHLSGTLGKVRQRARGLVKGWAVNAVTGPGLFGVGGGGGP